MRKQFLLYLFIFWGVLLSDALQAKNHDLFKNPGIGFEIGSWKPNSLKKEAAVSPFGVTGASPFLRFFVISPQFRDWTFRCSLGYWAQTQIRELPDVGSVTLVLFMFDLKQRIIPESRLTPFVSYGISIFSGSEYSDEKWYQPFGKNQEVGFGANVGTGFDFLLGSRWVVTTEFCYHYVRFNRDVGRTDDYSGPKISVGFYYLF